MSTLTINDVIELIRDATVRREVLIPYDGYYSQDNPFSTDTIEYIDAGMLVQLLQARQESN